MRTAPPAFSATLRCVSNTWFEIALSIRAAIEPALVSAVRTTLVEIGRIHFALIDAFGAGAPRSNPSVLRSSSMSGQWIP